MKISKSTQELNAIAHNIAQDIFESESVKPANIRSVLVTGGTGFLGIHLLYEIICKSDFEKVYAIVRDVNKLKSQALKYIGFCDWLDNIICIEKDLLTVSLSDLPPVSHVIHSAAEIHCLKTLAALYDINCLSTAKLLKWYAEAEFIFISSLSVFVSSSISGTHEAQLFTSDTNFNLYGGYAQSKYIGERLCQKHKNAKIVRPGLLTGSTTRGISGHDFLTKFLSICKNLKVYPSCFEESFVDITPVDICAQKIVTNVLLFPSKVMHIANKRSLALSKIVSQMSLKPVSKQIWYEKLSEFSKIDQILMEYAFFKKDCLLNYPNFFNIDLFQSTGHYYAIDDYFCYNNEHLLKLYLINLKDEHI